VRKLVVLSGAGMSAESGIKTFRDYGGLWEQYHVHEIATPEAWHNNLGLVIDFYNQRRKQLYEVTPNEGHFALKELENFFQVDIITQNVDDLHERAGSSNVLHLHGELKKIRSTINPEYIILLDGWELKLGDKCPQGGQLRPHIVWFGEEVPLIDKAIEIVEESDIMLVVGTSLNVYPAAGLLQHFTHHKPVYLIDPNKVETRRSSINFIQKTAVNGISSVSKELIKLFA